RGPSARGGHPEGRRGVPGHVGQPAPAIQDPEVPAGPAGGTIPLPAPQAPSPVCLQERPPRRGPGFGGIPQGHGQGRDTPAGAATTGHGEVRCHDRTLCQGADVVTGDRVITGGRVPPIRGVPPWWLRLTARWGIGGWGDRDKNINKRSRYIRDS